MELSPDGLRLLEYGLSGLPISLHQSQPDLHFCHGFVGIGMYLEEGVEARRGKDFTDFRPDGGKTYLPLFFH